MKKTLSLLVTLCLCALPVVAAPPKDVPPGHWAAKSVQHVTQDKIMGVDASGKFNGSKAVTRYELAVVLDRFVRYIEAGKKPLTPTTPIKGVALPKTANPQVRQALAHLTTYGFIARNSPLVVKDGSKPATAQELADAMAQVTIRLSDRSLPPQKD